MSTLSTLLGKRIAMSAQKLSVGEKSVFLNEPDNPVEAAEVKYSQGAKGSSMLLLKKEDALAIFNLLVCQSDTDSP